MFGLRLVAFSVAALLCGTINVAAMRRSVHGSPTVYHPATGEVRAVPVHDQAGNIIGAPFTHNTNSDHLKPKRRAAPAGSGVGGGVRAKTIYQVQAHHHAASSHSLAAQAHRSQEHFHNQQYAYHLRTGNTGAAMHMYHGNQAAMHADCAQKHEAAAANHHWAADGPDVNAQHRAQESANHAQPVHHSSNAADHHDQCAQALALAEGNHHGAYHYQPVHNVGGGVRPDHIVAHSQSISRPHGSLRGKSSPPREIANIQAKYLEQAHRNAAYEHNLAVQAHRYRENFHSEQSAFHFHTGNALAGTQHSNQAAMHAGYAQKHEVAAANHHWAASAVNGPDENALYYAQESAGRAHGVHQSFYAADRLDQSALTFSQQGYPLGVQYYSGVAHNARQSANRFSSASFYSHSAATGRYFEA